MICSKCGKPIKERELYKHVNGVGDVHHKCPSDQARLMAEDDTLPIDHVPETYPD